MSNQPTFATRSGTPAWRVNGPFRASLARGIRAIKLAGSVFGASGQFIPLGDNSELLGLLAARVRAARDYGA